ncbi:MAG TPA: hypothetical protein GXX47_01750 [Firmicutes bacterium]|nr:hypothetical protein [Bacillota bacterium]
MNSRFVKGLIYGGLIGAAVGAYWMLKTDSATERMLLEKDRQIRRSARRTMAALQDKAHRMGSVWKSSRRMVGAGRRS